MYSKMSVSKQFILDNCDTGDILLYNSRTIVGRIIEYCTYSKFSHVVMILKNPIHIDPSLTGLYIIESGKENIPDVISGKKILGVQIIPLEKALEYFDNAYVFNLYYRKLNCERNTEFNNKVTNVIKKVEGSPYDLNVIDWVKARFDIEIGDCHKTNTFWCSALVSYLYVKMGLLDPDLSWSLIPPKKFSYYENDRLTFQNCSLECEKKIEFK
jgi:hypothetical protein